MARPPRSSRLRSFVLGVLCAMPLSCMQVVAHKSQLIVASAELCPVGSEGCPCTAGGGCDPGLWCDAGVCVSSYSGDGGEYAFEDDMIMEASAPEPVKSISVSGRASTRRPERFHRQANRDIAPAPAAESIATSSTVDAAGIAAGQAEPQDPADTLDHAARQVIYTAALQVAVYDLDAAAELAESLPGRYGGWIESRYDYQITLRITAAHLFEAIEELSALGIVLDKALYAQDVTAEYIDLESRIRVLEQLVAHLEDMLKMAKTVEEMLKIRTALDRARLELASARARMRELSESIDFSTLTLILTLRGPGELFPSSNDPFPWVESLGVEAVEYR